MDVAESDVYEQLVNAALRFVSFRARSRKEILDFLTKKLTRSHTVAPLVLNKVMERMTELGYINDDAFALWWTGTRTGRKPKGAKAIRIELIQKGVDSRIADRAIGLLLKGDKSESTLARGIAVKKAEALGKYPKMIQKQKLGAFLLRRGFSSDTVWSVVDDVVENV